MVIMTAASTRAVVLRGSDVASIGGNSTGPGYYALIKATFFLNDTDVVKVALPRPRPIAVGAGRQRAASQSL